MCSKEPVGIDGEVFLNGPDELRVKVAAGYEEAAIMCCLVESGRAASDRKDQGIAALTVTYRNGDEVAMEITSTALVRVHGTAIQVDAVKLMSFLERLCKEGPVGTD